MDPCPLSDLIPPSQGLNYLLYPRFLVMLDDLALQHHDVCKMADASAALALEEGAVKNTPEVSQQSPGQKINTKTCLGSSSRDHHRINSRTRSESTSPTRASPDSGVIENSPRKGPRTSLSTSPGKNSKHSPERGSRKQDSSKTTVKTVKSRQPMSPAERNTNEGARAAATEARAGAMSNAGAESKSRLSEFIVVGEFRPDDQRLLVLLQNYILVKSKIGREVCYKPRVLENIPY